jgi:hypothetical protein
MLIFVFGVYIGGIVVASFMTMLLVEKSEGKEKSLSTGSAAFFVLGWPVLVPIMYKHRKTWGLKV